MKIRVILLLTLILVFALPGSSYAQSEEDSPLLEMLAYIPDTPEIRDGVGAFTYIGLAANQAVLAQDPFSENVELSQPGFGWPIEFSRTKALALLTFPRRGGRNDFLDRMQEVAGFNWRDVDHFIEINIRRNNVSYAAAYGGDFDQAAIDTALTARGFDRDERDGIPVWHRMDDDDLDVGSEESADPFGNGIYAARIALNDNQLVYAQNWPTMDVALDGPSLASADDFRVLAEAISEVGDPIWVAFYREFHAERTFFPGDGIEAILESWTESLGTDASEWGILPPSPIFALVDYQDGDDQINAIALVYDNVASAEIAAGELTHRLETISPNGYEEIGAAIDPPFIYVDESGYAAVLASVRYPLDLGLDFENSGALPGSLINGWRVLITDGSFLTLASEL